MRVTSSHPFVLTAVLPLLVLPALACLRAGGSPASPAPGPVRAQPSAPTPSASAAPAAMAAPASTTMLGHMPMRHGGTGPMMRGMTAGRMGMGGGGMAGPAGCPVRAAMLASAGAPPGSATGAARLAAADACPEPTAGLAATGKTVFLGKGNCYTCHGMDAKGTPLAPNLMQHKWLNIDGSYEAIARVVIAGVPHPKEHPAPMPPMGGARLSASEVCAVAAYVYRLSHKS